MTPQTRPDTRLPRGWTSLAHKLVQAPRRRRPEFALTEPAIFRSECFAEDLPAVARPTPVPARRRAGAGWLAAAPLGLALVGAAASLLAPLA